MYVDGQQNPCLCTLKQRTRPQHTQVAHDILQRSSTHPCTPRHGGTCNHDEPHVLARRRPHIRALCGHALVGQRRLLVPFRCLYPDAQGKDLQVKLCMHLPIP